MSHHPKLGLLGLGSRSTAFYLTHLNQIYNEKFGGYNTCPLVLLNTNFDHINPFLPDQFKQLTKNLTPYLSSMTCEQLMVPNITLHQVLDEMSISNLVHPVRKTIEVLQQDDHKQITLFGSEYSMNAPYLTKMMKTEGIDVIIPSVDDQKQLDSWRIKAYIGKETIADIQAYNDLIKDYENTAPVVIACTELSIILKHASEQVYDMSRIQIHASLC